jgi:group I intron endonuclease
MNYINPFN